MEHGHYSELAGAYAAHRPGYADAVAGRVLAAACAAADKPVQALEVADVGAGTGIWSRVLARAGCRVRAVEPNDAMREAGASDPANGSIRWHGGRAEATGLATRSCDLVTMASAFHWTEFEAALAEFARVLRPHGVFAALWNTRIVDESPLLAEIEAELRRRVPHYVPRSSGRSAFCDSLSERLRACGRFALVETCEGRHVEAQSRERYLGIWRSVNDVRVQAGEQTFADFLEWLAWRLRDVPRIEAPYLTRCWIAHLST